MPESKLPIRIASAPVSWGVMEETDTGVWPPAKQVMEEIADAGYSVTELGPHGYYATSVPELRSTLDAYGLTLTSAFVPVRWFQADRLAGDLAALMNVSRVLAALE